MNKRFYKELGEQLKKIRISKNLSQQDVADRLGITRASYSHFENGVRVVDIDTLYKIADIFAVDINDITNPLRKYVYKK